MDIVTYILCRKIAQAAVSGIQNIEVKGNTLYITLSDGTVLDMVFPTPKDGVDGKDGKDGIDGKDGKDGAPGKDGVDGQDGKDGIDGKDGVSITKVEIKNNHLICTLSDGSVMDAGELPGSGVSEGGVMQFDSRNDFPANGDVDILYLAKDTKIIYYWDGSDYQEIAGGESEISVELETASIEFDDVNDTFDAPVDDVKLNIYVNGMYLTEEYDYTIDRDSTPNKITFDTIYEEEDICTITYFKKVSGSGFISATSEDIDSLFEEGN